jgi:lipopolysaccharide transport system permease protein
VNTIVDCPEAPPPAEPAAAHEPPAHAHGGERVTVIERRPGWQFLNWRELVDYRDLFWFLTWRRIKVRYAQSALGIGWAVLQPLVSTIVFTIVFGVLARMRSDGAPYAAMTLTALAPWTFFSGALTDSTASLVQNANMLSKIYFPRLLLPLSAAVSKLVDFGIALVMLFGLLAFYGEAPNWGALALPLLVLLMLVAACGMGLWLAASAVQYRDVQHAMHFGVQVFMYASPVIYPVSLIPARFQYVYAVNPMVGVIEGFRSALLGTRPMPWDLIAIGAASSLVIAVTGLIYFRSKERLFADVV